MTVSPPQTSNMNRKEFTLSATNKSRTEATLTPSGSKTPAYTVNFSFILGTKHKHSVLLRRGDTPSPSASSSSTMDPEVLGAVDLTCGSLSKPIHLCLGNPGTDTLSTPVTWQTLRCNETMKTNAFGVSLPSPTKSDKLDNSSAETLYEWRRTHDVKAATAMLDFLNFKLVETETGRVVAGFEHHFFFGSKRGFFWIAEDEETLGKVDEKWEVGVLLSGLGVLEYTRKMWGYSF